MMYEGTWKSWDGQTVGFWNYDDNGNSFTSGTWGWYDGSVLGTFAVDPNDSSILHDNTSSSDEC